MNKWNWQKTDWLDIAVTVILLVSIALGVAALVKLAAIGMGWV